MPSAIEHLIVLMMENRSFDHMLGYLAQPDYPIEGLTGNETNSDSTGQNVPVSPNALRICSPDPYHDFRSVNVQIFGTENPATGAVPTMSSFVQNYESPCNGDRAAAAGIMRCWAPAQLPVLTTLAKQYAICDHWFSRLRRGGSFPFLVSS